VQAATDAAAALTLFALVQSQHGRTAADPVVESIRVPAQMQTSSGTTTVPDAAEASHGQRDEVDTRPALDQVTSF
jgi:hypothetical protein